MSVRIAEEEGQRNRCRPAATLWAEGVADDLCVTRRRRCPCIASSSLLDLPSQASSANVIVLMKRGTKKLSLKVWVGRGKSSVLEQAGTAVKQAECPQQDAVGEIIVIQVLMQCEVTLLDSQTE